MRVLIVDDTRDAADTLAILLRRWGHEVEVAYDGLSAIATARRFRPEVAVLDIQMPKLSGGAVAMALKKQAGLDGITVVATSATEPDDARLARYDGVFDAFLPKPYDPQMVNDLLKASHSYAAA
jgi:CheY-like chemotaxis protein